MIKILQAIHSTNAKSGGTSNMVLNLDAFLKGHSNVKSAILSFDKECESNLSVFRKTISFIERMRILRCHDIVHVHGVWSISLLFVSLIAFIYRKKLVISSHGMLEPWAFHQKRFKKLVAYYVYQKWLLKHAEFIHVTSTNEERSVRDLGFENVLLIENGIEIDANRLDEARNFSKRGHYKYLFLSRIHKKKGIHELLHAWERAQMGECKLAIVGPVDDGKYFEEIIRIISDKGLCNVKIFPAVYNEEKWDVYMDADIFILPSYSENFGLVVGEALGCGLPVITTSNTPWGNISKLNCGWVVDMSIEELATVLRNTRVTDEADLLEKSMNGQSFIKEALHWEVVGLKYVQAYECI